VVSLVEGVTLYTAFLPPISTDMPPGRTPLTPPPRDVVEPTTPEKDSDWEEFLRQKAADSPRRLRRIRGSVSGSHTSIPGALSGSEVIAADAASRERRNSVHLHHPKPLKSSPKSAYLKDGEVVERRQRSTVISFDQISPISPLETSTSSSIDDSDTEQGGALLPDSNISQPSVQIVEPERERVVDRSGRRVTPWATPRALSYNTDFGTQEDENDVFVDAPETLEASPITPPGIENEFWSARPKEPVRSFSASRHDAATQTTAVDTASPVNSPHQEANDKRIVLIQEAEPSTSQKQLLPAVNLIPATPSSLSTLEQQEKQLGHGPLTPTRMPNTNSSKSDSIPEDSQVDISEASLAEGPAGDNRRPSIAALPNVVRESKLHPWWRPKRLSLQPDDEFIDMDGRESESGFLEDMVRADTVPHRRKQAKNGRTARRIKGTKFVVEFVGLSGLKDVMRRGSRRGKGTTPR
jgi:hypothetical protein